MSNPPTWATFSIAAAAVLSPVLVFLMAIAVGILSQAVGRAARQSPGQDVSPLGSDHPRMPALTARLGRNTLQFDTHPGR